MELYNYSSGRGLSPFSVEATLALVVGAHLPHLLGCWTLSRSRLKKRLVGSIVSIFYAIFLTWIMLQTSWTRVEE